MLAYVTHAANSRERCSRSLKLEVGCDIAHPA